jgi:translation elongation factor P/translation initiation factor 5A
MKDSKLKQLRVNAEEVVNKDSGTSENQTIKRVEIPDSPFHIITIDGESFGVMGDYRLTEKSASETEVREELSKITWNRIVQVIMLLEEVRTKINNKIKEQV